MVVGLGVARVQEGHVVDVLGHLGKDFRSPGAALPMLAKFEGRLHQWPDLIREEAGVLVETGQLLAISLGELRLIVPGVDLAGTTIHEQPNYSLGLRRKMCGPRGHWIDG